MYIPSVERNRLDGLESRNPRSKTTRGSEEGTRDIPRVGSVSGRSVASNETRGASRGPRDAACLGVSYRLISRHLWGLRGYLSRKYPRTGPYPDIYISCPTCPVGYETPVAPRHPYRSVCIGSIYPSTFEAQSTVFCCWASGLGSMFSSVVCCVFVSFSPRLPSKLRGSGRGLRVPRGVALFPWSFLLLVVFPTLV